MIKFNMEKIKKHGFEINENIIITHVSCPKYTNSFRTATNKERVLNVLNTFIRKMNLFVKFNSLKETNLTYKNRLMVVTLNENQNQLTTYIDKTKLFEKYVEI